MKDENAKQTILTFLKESGEISTPEIAEKLGIDSSVVRQRLKQLAFEGKVSGRRLGKRLIVWKLIE